MRAALLLVALSAAALLTVLRQGWTLWYGDAEAHLDALTAHLRQHTPWGAHVSVTRGEKGEPYAIDATGAVYDAARAAFRQAWDTDPIDMGMGGSIPFMAGCFCSTLCDACSAPRRRGPACWCGR